MDFKAKALELQRMFVGGGLGSDARTAFEAALREAYTAGRNDQAAWVDTFTDDQQ